MGSNTLMGTPHAKYFAKNRLLEVYVVKGYCKQTRELQVRGYNFPDSLKVSFQRAVC